MSVALAAIAAVACGNNAGKQTEQTPVAQQEQHPSVAVAQVFVRKVPQEATYTSTIQPYVKNNIVPQTAGRITKINVEVGDRYSLKSTRCSCSRLSFSCTTLKSN